MPSLIVDAQNIIFGTSADDIPAGDAAPNLVIDIDQTQFDALPDNVTDYPHRWNVTSTAAEVVFDLATYRTQIISQFAEQAETLRVGRFSSSALATAYNYDSDRANLFIILAAGVANQNAMLTTFTGQTPTDRQHTPVQLQAVARSYFDHIAGINTRLATATSAVNAATTQAVIDAVTL